MIETLENNWLSIPKQSQNEKEGKECEKCIGKKEALVLDTTCQYAENSTAHGISYIFEKDRLPAERLLWACIVITGFSFR